MAALGTAHRTIVEAIDAGCGSERAGYTFIQGDGEEKFFSWDRLRSEAINRAYLLRRAGLRKGDRLAMVVPDGTDFVPTFLGALWAGVVPVPLYPPLSLGKLDAYLDSLRAILRKAEPALLCTDRRVQKVLWSVVPRVPSLRGVLYVEDLASDVQEADGEREKIAPSDLAFLQFTSGSTSAPKGVMVTHESLSANCNAIMYEGLESDSERDVGVSWLPLYHDMGLIGFVMAPMFAKVPVAFLPTLSFVKSATLWIETIHRKRGTISFAPNFAYALVTKRVKPEMLARWDLSCMRAFGCGAEPIHADTLRRFIETFRPTGLKPEALLPCYGMAEATLAISFAGLRDNLKTDVHRSEGCQPVSPVPVHNGGQQLANQTLEVVCCGRPFQGHEIRIVDEAGVALPERSLGEILFRGPSVAAGYYSDPQNSRVAFESGWLRTGDLGYVLNGELYIVGRRKDLVIIKGRNYDPQRIEWIAEEVPTVRKGSAVAFSRPGVDSEELVVVAESRNREGGVTAEAIRQRINEQMQLVAADVLLLEPGSLPKTSSGKLQRQKTRAQYLAGGLGSEGVRSMGATAQMLVLAKHVAISFVGRARHFMRGLLRRGTIWLRQSGEPVD